MRLGDYVMDYRSAEALFRTPTQRTWLGLFLVSLLLLPFIAGQYLTFLACLVAIHVIAATGLNITTGFTGLISIGHAVGAYTVAVLANLGTPFWLSLPAGAGLAALIGLAVGLPSLRIKGLYLAVATLAAQFLLSFVFREWESVTGGVRGLNVPPATLAGWAFDSDAKIYFLIMPLTVLVVLGARNLFRTRIGLFRSKLLSFAIGAAYAGLAGGLWAYFYRAITPESFTLQLGIFYLAAIIVGGLGSILGSVLGALFMALVPELLRALVGLAALYSTNAAILLSPLREIVFGALIIAFLIFEPHGLAEIWRRVRRYFFLWPFRT